MNSRERALRILHYHDYDRLPVVHFGIRPDTLRAWHGQGHLTAAEVEGAVLGDEEVERITTRLGFDFGWAHCLTPNTGLLPSFERKVLEELPDGFRKILASDGTIILERKGAGSIPAHVDYTLKGRREWEECYLPRLQYSDERINWQVLETLKDDAGREKPIGLHCGSLFGVIRNWLTLEGSAYLLADDEALFDEIIDTVGELCYRCVERVLAAGARFDFAHFWEDICFRSGPLVNPRVFERKVGPHYKRITELAHRYGIEIVSLDCDGKIDALIPIWLQNGVNTMFPIEVGPWEASIAPWRAQYGRELRGVGGVDKRVFSQDYAAVDTEIERLRPLVDLGGYIPCPDHRLPPDAKWENVQYYCERMRRVFG